MSRPTDPRVEVELRSGTSDGFAAVVVLYGEHDLATSHEIQDALEPIIGNVLVDLSDCAFLDSSVISVLIGSHRARMHAGQRLELLVPPRNAPVMRTLAISGVSQLVHVRSSQP